MRLLDKGNVFDDFGSRNSISFRSILDHGRTLLLHGQYPVQQCLVISLERVVVKLFQLVVCSPRLLQEYRVIIWVRSIALSKKFRHFFSPDLGEYESYWSRNIFDWHVRYFKAYEPCYYTRLACRRWWGIWGFAKNYALAVIKHNGLCVTIVSTTQQQWTCI